MSTQAADQTYAAELAQARITALRALTDLLQSTDDPVEKRRIATAILKLPKPDLEPREHPEPVAPTTFDDNQIVAIQPAQSDEPPIESCEPVLESLIPANITPEIPYPQASTTHAARLRAICGTDQPTGPPDSWN